MVRGSTADESERERVERRSVGAAGRSAKPVCKREGQDRVGRLDEREGQI